MRWLIAALVVVGALAGALLMAQSALFEDEIVQAIKSGSPTAWRRLRITADEWTTHCPKEADSYTAEGEATEARLDHLWRRASRKFAECAAFPWAGAKRIWSDRAPRQKGDECNAGVTRLRPHSIYYENGDTTWKLKLLRSHVLPGGKQVLVKPPGCRPTKPVRVELARRHASRMCVCKDAACQAEAERLNAERVKAAERARGPDAAMDAEIAGLMKEAEACRAKLK